MSIILILPIGCGLGTNPESNDQNSQIRELSSEEHKIVESGKIFGLKLFQNINQIEAEKNIFISPLSVSMALGMTMNGAAGETYDAMKQTLEFNGLTEEEINKSYKSLINLLTDMDEKVLIEIANSIWYRQNYNVEDTFKKINEEYFNAQITAMDFNNPNAVDVINNWVSINTHGKIESIIKEINPMTIMFLINAIYFKGIWTYQFDQEKTEDDLFISSLDDQIPCKMMQIQGRFKHFQDNQLQMVDLPYGDENYSMIICLPNANYGVDKFIEDLNEENWQLYLQSLDVDSGIVQMPKFKLEYEITMNDVLKSMGMAVAFNAGAADFSQISPGSDLYIYKVKHKSFIQTDEEGTEAAAVTVVEMRELSGDPQPKTFFMRIDQPFVFIIREQNTNAILFMGKVLNPNG